MASEKEGNIASNSKFIGLVGIFASLIFLFGTLAAVFACSGFQFGIDDIKELGGEMIFKFVCIIAGAFLVMFGVGIMIRNIRSSNMPGELFGLLMAISGVLLAAVGITSADKYVIWIFVIVLICAALAEIWYEYATQQYIFLVIAALLTIIMAATAATDAIQGFGFFIFAMIWVFYESVLFLLPEVEEAPTKAKAKETKKNEPKARPYPATTGKAAEKKQSQSKKQQKSTATPKAEPAKEPVKVVPVAAPVKAKKAKKEKPVKEEPKVEPVVEAVIVEEVVKEEPKAEPVVEAVIVEEVVKEEPKAEPVVETPVEEAVIEEIQAEPVVEETIEVAPVVEEEPKAEPVIETPVEEAVIEEIQAEPVVEEPIVEEEIEVPVVEEVIEEDPVSGVEESSEETFEIVEDTPDALVRRATWNHGLRCRRDYGEHQIPIAFVKAKVAVYVVPEVGDTSSDEELKAEGWTVLRYVEGDITDGKKEGDEIAATAKANLKAAKAAAKTKASKK